METVKRTYDAPQMEIDTMEPTDILTESLTVASFVESNRAQSAMVDVRHSPWNAGSGK